MIEKVKPDMEITREDVLDVLGREEGQRFIDVMDIVDDIIENPQSLVGNTALLMAAKLAAFRTKIGTYAQLYKTIDAKSIETRRRKDIMFTMYASLEENINTLKLLGRIESSKL